MHDRTRRRGDDGDSAASGGGHVAPGKTTRTQLIQLKAKSGGAPLPDAARAQFEGSLGADLSSVRVHTGASSAEAAEGLGARAFATGQDIHFGAGQYQPDDPFGMHLLAHEVAHTVQQGSAGGGAQMKLEVSTPGDAYESEADVAAEAMVRGAPASVSSLGGEAPVQRFDLLGGSASLGIPGLGGGGAGYESFADDEDDEYDTDEDEDPYWDDGSGQGIPPPPVPGAKGAEVLKLQKVLGVPPTGLYDEATVGALYEFQISQGFDPSIQLQPQIWARLYPRMQKQNLGGGGGGGAGWHAAGPKSFGGGKSAGKKKSTPKPKEKKKPKKKGGFGFGG
jgi:hypothetical protein